MKNIGNLVVGSYNTIFNSSLMRKSEMLMAKGIDRTLARIDPRMAVFAKLSKAWQDFADDNKLQPSDILRMTSKYGFLLLGMTLHSLATRKSIIEDALVYKAVADRIDKAVGYDEFQQAILVPLLLRIKEMMA